MPVKARRGSFASGVLAAGDSRHDSSSVLGMLSEKRGSALGAESRVQTILYVHLTVPGLARGDEAGLCCLPWCLSLIGPLSSRAWRRPAWGPSSISVLCACLFPDRGALLFP